MKRSARPQKNRDSSQEGRMKLVFLDKKTIGEDMDFSQFARLGEVVGYDFTEGSAGTGGGCGYCDCEQGSHQPADHS